MKWLALAIGGLTGTFARYFLAGMIYRHFGTSFPYGTLAVNLSGCFFIGLLAALSEEKFLLGPNARLLLMIGFCGAFTTFSTFILETANLMKSGETLRAFMNLLTSVIAGFIVFRLGFLLGETI
ncbi:MAG: fluoride efflux transporter CrcB [Candidatus Omnitrophica bacterium]|nr:fluoride efflux transporter CrcB [Candidatus Omnitrophota bacterium]MDD5671550.1 fluoride efflux transporter CrcB [Candidatus Omnitrophota bacterium]